MHHAGPKRCFWQDLNPKFFFIREKNLIRIFMELRPRVYSDHCYIIKKSRLFSPESIRALEHHVASSTFDSIQRQSIVPSSPPPWHAATHSSQTYPVSLKEAPHQHGTLLLLGFVEICCMSGGNSIAFKIPQVLKFL